MPFIFSFFHIYTFIQCSSSFSTASPPHHHQFLWLKRSHTCQSSSTAQVPESTRRRKNEKHSRKLQWGSGDQHHQEVKVPKLTSSLLYYTFWDLLVHLYMIIAGQVAFNDNPVQLTFLYPCFSASRTDPVNLYVPPRCCWWSVDGFPSPGIHLAFKMFFCSFLDSFRSHITESCPFSKIV